MEILIVGGILVVIMVIVSTQIKKSAAAAYKAESVETDKFRIEKPEGFLYPLREEPDFPFEAYSKTYGDKSTRNIWRARVRLRIADHEDANLVKDSVIASDEEILSEKVLDDLPTGEFGTIVRSKKIDDEVSYRVFRKIIVAGGQSYELRTTILEPYADEYTPQICEMMKSFVLK